MSKEVLLGKHVLRIPFLLGAMSRGFTRAPLVSEVARLGCGGTLGISGLTDEAYMEEKGLSFDESNRERAREEVRESRRLTRETGGIIGANLMRAARDYEGIARAALDEGLDYFVSAAAFDPDLPRIAKDYPNTAFIMSASSKKIVRRFCDLWEGSGRLPDGFIVEGPDAGGHLGYTLASLRNPNRQLEATVRDVKAYLKSQRATSNILLIAAGGIESKEDVQRMLSEEVGADAVQAATPFITTIECSAGRALKEMHLKAARRGTTIIESPVGLLGRAINNEFTDKINSEEFRNSKKVPFNCKYVCLEHCRFRKTGETFCIWNALEMARIGNRRQVEKFAIAFTGANVGNATEIVPAEQIINNLFG